MPWRCPENGVLTAGTGAKNTRLAALREIARFASRPYRGTLYFSTKPLKQGGKANVLPPFAQGQWDRSPRPRGRPGSAGGAVPWLAGALLFLASPDFGAGGCRLPRRRPGHARFWRE